MRIPRFIRGRPVVAALVGLVSATCPLAQDVTLSPLQWAEASDPPDDLPVPRGGLAIRFPAELKATPDIGYTFYEAVIDAKGRLLVLHPRATLPTLLRAETLSEQRWTFSPAKREGKAVTSAIHFAVLFNPASAATEGSDATPRLLDVTPIRLPRPKGLKPSENVADQVVTLGVTIHPDGSVVVTEAPEALRGPAEIAAKNWRFAPARKGAQPVAAAIQLPVIVVTADARPGGGMTQPPRATHQEKPIYPYVMRASGMRGEVVVDFIVDIEGRVRNPYVLRSLNPSFDDPAIEAVRKWRFEPARAGDRPINAHMQVPILFSLNEAHRGGHDGMEITRKDLSKLPEELRYDTPPRVRGSARPVYPYAALLARREGQAVVRMLIDEKGRVVDAAVAQASAPEFGQALLAAVERFEYEPALKRGQPCKALISFSQEFTTAEEYQLVSSTEQELLRREQKKPDTIAKLAEVDGGLRPLSRRPPRFPLSRLGKVAEGQAHIEFLVDQDGRASLPRVVSASDEAFGYAAMQGVAAWRFEPPRRGGRAVVVRVQVPVHFGEVDKGRNAKP